MTTENDENVTVIFTARLGLVGSELAFEMTFPREEFEGQTPSEVYSSMYEQATQRFVERYLSIEFAVPEGLGLSLGWLAMAPAGRA